MVNYTWNSDIVPSNLKVSQVYGIAFSKDSRILLMYEDNSYKLIGGHPEKSETYEETLKREFLEEVNTVIDNCHYLGYLLVEENNSKYAQVRMIAEIKQINDKKIDPATGKIYDRLLVSTTKVKEYLNYQTAGNRMLDEAIRKATKEYLFTKPKANNKGVDPNE